MSVCPSKRPYVCPFVRPSICNMYELLLTYCYGTNNLRNCPVGPTVYPANQYYGQDTAASDKATARLEIC